MSRAKPKSNHGSGSAFDVLTTRSFSITFGGKRRKASLEEVMQQGIYQAATMAKLGAAKEVMSWILERETALPTKSVLPKFEIEQAGTNIDRALLVLDIVGVVNGRCTSKNEPFLLIEPWVPESALSRLPRELDSKQLIEVRRFVRPSYETELGKD